MSSEELKAAKVMKRNEAALQTHVRFRGPLVCVALHHRVERVAGVHQTLTPGLAPGSTVSVAT